MKLPPLLLLVLISTALRLALAAGLGPGNDEAYYALFIRHPDWSYHDQPPMVAAVAAVGLAAAGVLPEVFALRLGFIALGSGSLLLMACLAGRLGGPRAGLAAAFALAATGYYGGAAGLFALPDGPLLFFWLLTLDRLAAAFAGPPDRLRPWLAVGLAWGGALLSKYHAAFLPIGAAVYLAIEPRARPWLRRPGPYLALGIGLAAFAPVVAWNAAHGWASFAFQGARAVGGPAWRPDALLGAILGPAAYLFPWVWPFVVASLARAGRRLGRGAADPADRFLLAQALPPLVAFLGVACRREVLPHWSLVGLLPAFPLLGRDWAGLATRSPGRLRGRMAVLAILPVALAAFSLLQARTGLLPIPPAADPTADLAGWEAVARELARRGLIGPEHPGRFVLTSKWYASGQLAFAAGPAVPVACYSGDARGFARWSRPDDWLGRDGLLVVLDPCSTEPAAYDRWFERIEPAGALDVVRGGVTIRRLRLYLCRRQARPFPFGPADRRGTGRRSPAGGCG